MYLSYFYTSRGRKHIRIVIAIQNQILLRLMMSLKSGIFTDWTVCP